MSGMWLYADDTFLVFYRYLDFLVIALVHLGVAEMILILFLNLRSLTSTCRPSHRPTSPKRRRSRRRRMRSVEYSKTHVERCRRQNSD